jgi:hypothetical protein
MLKPKSCYLAGPMRGYPRFNFDAFEEATKKLRAMDIEVVSPHEMDLGLGFNPDQPESDVTPEFINECVRRDIDAIIATEAVVFLPGFGKSTGAIAEMAVARWLNRPCYYFHPEDNLTVFPLDKFNLTLGLNYV